MDAGQKAQKIIVIHPGSLNLRIGRASDLNPITILHAVARRRRQLNGQNKGHKDSIFPCLQQESFTEFEEKRLQVIQTFTSQSSTKERGSKRPRVATPPQQIATFNKRSVPEELLEQKNGNVLIGKKMNNEKKHLNLLFDKDILQLSPGDSTHYDVHFPIRRGELHLHSEIGGSLSAVLADLETIWLYVICERMGISSKALSQYSAVLVIPDVYNRSHLREMVTLLLQRLRFRSCFLLQDHAAATFGAGLGYACVVDIGDQKVSISCVEDGISHPDSRVRLSYGGGDVSRVLLTLLQKCSFPYKDIDVEKHYADAALIMDLKERFCHMNVDVCGAQERNFEITKSGKRLRYTLQLGDECIVAPMSLFYTELLNITGKQKQVCVQYPSTQQSDAEDCFDAEYIRETGRRNGRDQLLEGVMPITGETGEDDIVVDDVVERDISLKNNDKEEQMFAPNGQIASLDLAIARSIERCNSDELKRKMYGCILLVGGGAKFPGLSKFLEQKVILQQVTAACTRSAEQTTFEVNIFMKEMDATIIAWKGAAIMSCLESAPELWISGAEWEKYGLRILREKAPFIW